MRTVEVDAADFERLNQWSRRHEAKGRQEGQPRVDLAPDSTVDVDAFPRTDPTPAEAHGALNVEVGLRVCARCGKPLHMSATVCRFCGEPSAGH
jgi:hypothetical protein